MYILNYKDLQHWLNINFPGRQIDRIRSAAWPLLTGYNTVEFFCMGPSQAKSI